MDIIITIIGYIETVIGFIMKVKNFVKEKYNMYEHLRMEVSYRLQVEGLGKKPNNIHLTWRITNTGTRALRIKSVGFVKKEHIFGKKIFHEVPLIYFDKPCSIPLEVEPLASLEISLSDGNQIEEARGFKYMYAKTEQGTVKIKVLPFSSSEVFSLPRKEYKYK